MNEHFINSYIRALANALMSGYYTDLGLLNHYKYVLDYVMFRACTKYKSNWGSPEGHMGHICVVMRAAHN